MDYVKKIITLCEERMISSTEAADAMGKTGVIPMMPPVNSGQYSVGLVRCLFTANGSNYYLHDQVDKVQADEIAVIFVENCEGKAVLGDIIAKYLLMHRKAKAIVVQGLVRDLSELKQRKYPIWCMGATPIGCINSPTVHYPKELMQKKLDLYENSIAICDDTGVVAIPKSMHCQDMINRLDRIQLQEAIWNYCIDELGWNTKRTICEKAYLNEISNFPARYKNNLENLRTKFTVVDGTSDQKLS